MNYYAWAVPLHSLELGVEGLFILVEVVVDSIEVGAWSPVEGRPLQTLSLSLEDIAKDALLGQARLSFLRVGHEGVIIVAVVIYVVWVDLETVVRETLDEVAATG